MTMRLPPALILIFGFSLPAAPAAKEPDRLVNLRKRGSELMRSGNWASARQVFHEGLAEARRLQLPSAQGRFLSNLGTLDFASFHSTGALDAFLQARQLGLDHRDGELEQVATLNIATVFARHGDWRKALEMVDSVGSQPWKSSTAIRAQFLLHRAIYLFRSERFGDADQAFRQALDYAAVTPDPLTQGRAWENWGLSYLARHDGDAAERCFLESFRIRFLKRNPEYNRLFLHWARLSQERGDSAAALTFARRALAAAEAGRSNYPAWAAHHAVAQALLGSGQPPAAIAEFRKALHLARQSRADVLPLDQLIVSSENSLFELYSAFVDAAFPLAQLDPAVMAEIWAVANENRQASYRLASLSPALGDGGLPAAYREALAKLQRLEMATSSSASQVALSQARLDLWTLESKLGLQTHAPGLTPLLDIRRIQSALPPDEALISFLTGERRSYAWLVTRDTLRAAVLPSRTELATLVSSFRHELASGLIPSSVHFRKILGEFFPVLATKQYWTVIVDGPLFELPLPALPVPDGRGLVADRFTVAFASGVPSFGSRTISSRADLVAFADPVYNRADSRRVPFQKASYQAAGLELPRLTGTARETQAVAAAWPGPKRVHLGPDANRARLLDTLRESPGVLHLATHVIAPPANPTDARLALSLDPSSAELEQLGPQDLLNLRHRVGLVVMTGCASGRGQAVPGAGFVGLSRAWLVSGAGGVLASLWPMPDDSGELATAFYRHLRRLERGPPHRRWARALQSAQREMRQSSGWRSQAPYWASYFLLMRSERSGL